ncbi:MAG: hypothetical protein LBP67_03065 [Bacteroidales bacterium]|jgi:hypothetical protein|nr:hypothetical protein [Bacteroidales bacterium]
MRKNIITIFCVLIILLLQSCNGREQYPIEPQITFNSYKLINENDVTVKCVLIIDFTDGDGDIGLEQGDTLPPYIPPYNNNLFVDYFEMQNGILTQVHSMDSSATIVNFNSRLPVLTPSGVNKNIKGTIYDTINFINTFTEYDTIMFSIYMVDRELHSSNVVESPLIVVKKNKDE